MRLIAVTGLALQVLSCSSDQSAQIETKAEESKMTEQHTNHLINENSPYLLSHAHNPVDWYPWGEEALAKAKAENKPIFLSIGYAACHWCHVMERESFENDSIAAMLNENFVSIKVDREQRPDLDEIYMTFTTSLTGSGGWPMSVFLTPDLKPFFAGTYFPPDDKYGRPGFKKVLHEIDSLYKENPEQVYESAEQIFAHVNQILSRDMPETMLIPKMITSGVQALLNTCDPVYGGIGNAPKFPHAVELSLMLRYYRTAGDMAYLEAVEKALAGMARGGIFDQVGGGFARYSTDRQWLVPHFEKMLYDNALLVKTYAEAWQVTGKEEYRTVVMRTLDFILNEMTDPSGGFYSALDADSEGEEGKFYVWTKKEIESILPHNQQLFCDYFNITDGGNFEGRNILNISEASGRIAASSGMPDFESFVKRSLEALYQARAERERPLTDDKILTSWNGLALSAFCKGYQITGEERYLNAAIANAEFIKEKLYADGKLTHSYRQERRSTGEFLEDYGYYINGLLDLYETDIDNNSRWLVFADQLARNAVELFQDSSGAFYLREDSLSDLIVRPKSETDGALPSPGSLMIASLLKLHRLTEDSIFYDAGEKGLKALSGLMLSAPANMASALSTLEYLLSQKVEIVIVGSGGARDEMLEHAYRYYLPNKLIAVTAKDKDSSSPLFAGRSSENDKAVAFVCRNSICSLPVTDINEFKKQLSSLQ